ncbi:MAG: hypothetical protein LBF12_01230 [Christensenellaceae bacterium]|jgi:hypothetical protein|nr:hypothetical protein [Christensenellaceae bacterium]
MKSFVSFLIGFIVGIALIVGSVGLVGYLVLSSYTVNDIADLIKIDKDKTGLTDDELSFELINTIFPLIKSFSNLSNMTVAEFESAIGTRALSAFLAASFGADADVIRNGALSKIMDNTIETLSLGPIVEILDIQLPDDIPLFKDNEFLTKPLLGQFSSFEDLRIDQLIPVVYDDQATAEMEASDAILQKIGVLSIAQLKGDSIMDMIGDMTVGDIMGTSGDDSILGKFSDTPIKDLNDTVDNMKITDLFEINDNDNAVLVKLRNGTYSGGTEGEPVKIKDINKALTPAIESCTIGDLLGAETEGEEKILSSLRDTHLTSAEMNQRMKELKLKDLFDNYDVGFMGLVPADTTLSGFSTAITGPVSKTSLFRLEKVGMYDFGNTLENSSSRSKSVFYNSSTLDILDTYLNILNGNSSTVNMGKLYEISGNFTSFDSYIQQNNITLNAGDTLVLTGDVTFDTSDNNQFIIPIAVNFMLNGKTLTLDADGVVFELDYNNPDADKTGYVYIDIGSSMVVQSDGKTYNGENGTINFQNGNGFQSSGEFKYERKDDKAIMVAQNVRIDSNNDQYKSKPDEEYSEINDET